MTQTFELTKKQELQRDAAASPARHVLAFGGSRSGKTFGFIRIIVLRALMAPGSRHLVARLHNIDVRQSVMMDTFPAVMRMCFPGVKYTVNKADQYVILGDGSEIWMGGLDDKERVEKILGKEYVTIYVNESSQIAFETIMVLRTRLAQNVFKSNGERMALKALYDLNPTTRSHWTYSEFVLGLRADNRDLKLPEGSRAFVQMNPVDNPNLPPEYLEELESLPERQLLRFRDGEYLSEVPGTLWPVERIDSCRVEKAPEMQRIVVSVDPSGSDGVGGDSQGIIVVGKGTDGKGYVLYDGSVKLSPAGWGGRVVELYNRFGADCVVAESNYGGAMVENTIKAVDDRVKVKLVSASRGKHVRAEPIAAFYESRPEKPTRVHHVGKFPELESQMSAFTTEGYMASGSPDRADALVWALTELLLLGVSLPGMLVKSSNRKKKAA